MLLAERDKAEPGADMETFGAGSQGPQPGRDYPPPAQADAGGGELRLSLDGKDLTVRPGQAVRVGRSPDNDLVTEAPTVSRHHAVLRYGGAGWEFENVGSAPTFLNGQQVTRLTVDSPLALVLGSADGPVLRAEAPARTRGTPGYAGAAGRPGPQGAGGPAAGAVPPAMPPAHHAAAHVDDEIATALHILFPLQSWLHDSGWRQGLRLLVIAYALLPLIFLAVAQLVERPVRTGLGLQPVRRAAVDHGLLAADPPRPPRAAGDLRRGGNRRVDPGVDQPGDDQRQRQRCTSAAPSGSSPPW